MAIDIGTYFESGFPNGDPGHRSERIREPVPESFQLCHVQLVVLKRLAFYLMLLYLLQNLFVMLGAGPGGGLVFPVFVFRYDEADRSPALACPSSPTDSVEVGFVR
jgi:hypothetical protein